jgi:predicted DCC family thiol-disulfide oxidoreductase YuxK
MTKYMGATPENSALPEHLILFDGVCNLCNAAVQFVIRHDPKEKFYFASMQSETGTKILQSMSLTATALNSFVYIANGVPYTQSTAALKAAKQLDGWASWLAIFRVVPAFIRDGVYRLVSKKRFSWFGRSETCMLPTPALKKRFLD